MPQLSKGNFKKKNYEGIKCDLKFGSYGFPEFAIAKTCFKSLFVTAIRASFFDFPLSTIRL